VCLAAADDATRQRCVRVIQAASAGGASSSLHHIASEAALTGELLKMKSLPAVNAVMAALGKAEVGGLDVPSLKAAGFDAAACRAAGYDLPSLKAAGFTISDFRAAGFDPNSLQSVGYDVLSLIVDFGYDAVASSVCDVSRYSALKGQDINAFILVPPPPPQSAQHGLTTAAQALGPKPSTSHPVTRVPQRDGGNLYATLHIHRVDDHTRVQDGDKPLHVPAGWQIADGTADDIRVCEAHPWQSSSLVFANGAYCGTAACDSPSHIGDRSFCCSVEKFKKINIISISAKTENQGKNVTSVAALHRTRRG
jgi:hypothetical protein